MKGLYNTFGRFVVNRIMCRLGMPASILNAWVASLDRLIRYPCVNGHYAEGITSTTGVPEGCSISVLSMIATSTVYASELQRWPTCICWQLELDVKTAKSPFWSFWENTSSCADHAFSRYSHWSPKKLALEHLQTFFRDACEMMDPIDGVSPTVKTIINFDFWCCTPLRVSFILPLVSLTRHLILGWLTASRRHASSESKVGFILYCI